MGQKLKEEERGSKISRGGMSQLWEGRARLDQEPGLEPEPSAKPPVFLLRSQDEAFPDFTASPWAAWWNEAPLQAALFSYEVLCLFPVDLGLT